MRFLPKYYDGMIAFVLDKKFEIAEYLNNENMPDRAILVINQKEDEILYEVKRYVAIKYYYSIRDELKKDDPTVEKELELYLNEQKVCSMKLLQVGEILNLMVLRLCQRDKNILREVIKMLQRLHPRL